MKNVKSAVMPVLTAMILSVGMVWAGSIIASARYKVIMSQQSAAGGALLTGGAYRMIGSAGQQTQVTMQGGGYQVSPGVMNASRTPQLTLNTSHAYPNPFNKSKGHFSVTFTRLTQKAVIRIYTVSGELLKTIKKDDNLDSVTWDVAGENGQKLASGLYVYSIEADNSTKRGKLIIIR